MKIKLFNSLTKTKEDFVPLDKNNIKIYVCGPTVYSYPHIGNARSVVIYDLLFRLFQTIYPKVTYVRNITDIDDKIIKAAKDQNISVTELSNKFIQIFHDDMSSLNVLKPTIEPKATDNIDVMIKMIEELIKNNHAYENEGHILFDVNSYDAYGKLSNRVLDEMIAGNRIEAASYKNNPLDFVLWKPAHKDDDISAIFDSPWGKGRPGWHIECSAMSDKFLGSDFDIHGGGADLQFPHHENEIAQGICSKKGSKHARYWVHNGFLTVNGEKMSKSLGNFITVRDLLDKNKTPLKAENSVKGIVLRYLLLSTHYQKPLDFSDKNLDDSAKSINKFYEIIKNFDDLEHAKSNQNDYLEEIKQALADNLNSPVAFSILHKIVKDFNKEQDQEKKIYLARNLYDSLEFLGLWDKNYLSQDQKSAIINEEYVLEQIEARKQAKADKNYQLADEIRNNLLEKHNVILEDKAGGFVEWKLKD